MKERISAILTAAVLGIIFYRIEIPIPFMLGGILAAAGIKFTVRPTLRWPMLWRNLGLLVGGYGVGRNFTVETAHKFIEQAPGIFGATLIAIALSLIIAVWTWHKTFANLLSCVMGILPGGLNQMMLLADEDKRVDANVVAVEQALRLFGVVASVPFLVVHLLGAKVLPQAQVAAAGTGGGLTWLVLVPIGAAGAFIAKKIHMPTPYLIGPIFATAIFSYLWGKGLQGVPFPLMSFAQINIGLYIGCMLDRDRLKKTGQLVPYAVAGTAIMVAASAVVARYLSDCYHFSLVTAFLAMAPGGIAEMCLAGLSMGEDVSTILTYQLIRVLILNLMVPLGLKWYFDENYDGR